jgi:phosphohistidine phosphatase SixA
VFVLVRHAHAGSKREWAGTDDERPLSDLGREQAQGLAASLSSFRPRRLIASPFVRCRQTLEPLAAATVLAVETCDLLLPGADVVVLDRHLGRPELAGAVLCTHGETIKALFRFWDAHGRVHAIVDGASARKVRTEKGAAWLVAEEASGRTAHYLAPTA